MMKRESFRQKHKTTSILIVEMGQQLLSVIEDSVVQVPV